MGRAKAILKHIQKKSVRRMTFTQRKQGLMKKISDFSTICGIDEACLIVYDGDGNGEAETWPQNTSRVHSILQKYEQQKSPETFGLEEFFDNKKAMVEAEIAKVKKEFIDIKYPSRHPCFNKLTNEQLRLFTAKLSAKIEACDHRLNTLKKEHQSEAATAAFISMQNMAQESAESSHASQLNSMLDISKGQLVPATMKPLNDNSVLVLV